MEGSLPTIVYAISLHPLNIACKKGLAYKLWLAHSHSMCARGERAIARDAMHRSLQHTFTLFGEWERWKTITDIEQLNSRIVQHNSTKERESQLRYHFLSIALKALKSLSLSRRQFRAVALLWCCYCCLLPDLCASQHKRRGTPYDSQSERERESY